MTDEEWEDWWSRKEPDPRNHDEICPRSKCDPREPEGFYGVDCVCHIIDAVMERETTKLLNLRGYRILTKELYDELMKRPEVPF